MKAAQTLHIITPEGTTVVRAGDTIPRNLRSRITNPAAIEGGGRRRRQAEPDPNVPQDGYAEMTVEDLGSLASEREIEGRSSMDKEQLIEALRAHDAENG